MRPIWSISADGTDVSTGLADYLISLSITDRDGIESDELSITVADPEASIALPRLGARLAVSIGYAQTGATPMGEFVADSIDLSGPPRAIAIRAHGADLRESMKQRETKDWEDTTLGAIVNAIAGKHGLSAAVDTDLASQPIAREDQTNESDIAFLTRLGQRFDAIASVKAGHLLFTKRGQGTSASGTPLPAYTLRPEQCTRWRISLTETGKYSAVEARYQSRETAETAWTRAGDGDGEALYRLRPTFVDQARAQAAADAKLAALQRGQGNLSLTLPGDPSIGAEVPIVLDGFHAEIDGRWITTSATHTLNQSGYVLTLEAEPGE